MEQQQLRRVITARHADLTDAITTVSYEEGSAYDHVSFGPSTTRIERNSVLLIPDLLSPSECQALIDDVEEHHRALQRHDHEDQAWSSATYGDAPTVGFTRHRIPMLSEATGALYERVLRERLLPFVVKELPELESYIWSRSESVCMQPDSSFSPPEKPPPGTPLPALAYKFSPQVRTIFYCASHPCLD